MLLQLLLVPEWWRALNDVIALFFSVVVVVLRWFIGKREG
jgi:hypothetical protein